MYQFIQGGSRSSQVINSLGNKIRRDTSKTETCSLTLRLLSEDSQSNRLMTFLYDQNSPGRNAT